jgi:hypothetical protein
MTSLLKALTNLLGCEVSSLYDHMNHPVEMKKIMDFLKGKKLRAVYNEDNRIVKFGGFSKKSAKDLHAYNGYLNM